MTEDIADDGLKVLTKVWEIKVKQYYKNSTKLEANIKKLYTLIWGQCTEHTKTKLKGLKTFKKMEKDKAAISLLKEL